MSDSSDDLRVELVRHLREHALQVSGPYVLRSGETSDWYLDARRTTFDGMGAMLVGRVVLGALDPRVEGLGGMTMGADPIALSTAVVASMAGQPLAAFSIRKRAKAHGIGDRLVGAIRAGQRVAVVEDTTTTGGAMLEAVEVMQEAGLEIVQALALVDRSDGRVAKAFGRRSIPYSALVKSGDLGIGS